MTCCRARLAYGSTMISHGSPPLWSRAEAPAAPDLWAQLEKTYEPGLEKLGRHVADHRPFRQVAIEVGTSRATLSA